MKALVIIVAILFIAANVSVWSCLLLASLSDRFLKPIPIDSEPNQPET